jgi:hypothetical protein
MAALERELATFHDNFAKLLSDGEGKFALVHGSRIVGIFDTYADALAEGYKLFKLEPFLVKQIQAIEQAHFIARATAPEKPGRYERAIYHELPINRGASPKGMSHPQVMSEPYSLRNPARESEPELERNPQNTSEPLL